MYTFIHVHLYTNKYTYISNLSKVLLIPRVFLPCTLGPQVVLVDPNFGGLLCSVQSGSLIQIHQKSSQNPMS